MPKVSVIIPVYNTEKYIARCLDSVCNQTLQDIEIICLNDCSPDNALQVLYDYAANDNRIKVVDFKENKGVSVARNTGIDMTQGEYIGFVDSDDFIDVNFYENLYVKAVETRAEVVKGEIQELDPSGYYIENDFYKINTRVKAHKSFFYHSFTSALYSRNFIKKNDIYFPEDINHFEDPYFAIKVAAFCKKIECIESTNYFYVRYITSETKQVYTEKTAKNIVASIKKILEFINTEPISKFHYIVVFKFILEITTNTISDYKGTEISKIFLALSYFLYKNEKYLFKKIRVASPELLLNEYKKQEQLHNPSIKILVSYIKPSFLFTSNTLTPIHLGRSVAMQCSKDGVASSQDLHWLFDNCFGDNDFEGNISHLNRRTGFLTGTYWAWKNYEKLGNPQYFGSFGYRKLLAPTYIANMHNYDVILPQKTEFYKTIREQCIDCHGKLFYNTALDIVSKTYPEEAEDIKTYFERINGYFYEIYIMKKEIFFEFCEWIFKILFNLYKAYPEQIHASKKKDFLSAFLEIDEVSKEKRDFAFILERITGYYLYKLSKRSDIKYIEVEVLSTENDPLKILSGLRNKVKKGIQDAKA